MKLWLGAMSVVALAAAAPAPAPSFEAGLSAYTANRVGDAEAIYAAVAADPKASAIDRAAANREMGRIAWLIDGDAGRAVRMLDAAVAVGTDVCETGALYVRVLREAGWAGEGAALGRRLLPTCTTPDATAALRTQSVEADLDAAKGKAGAERAAALDDARDLWSGLDADARASLEANRVRLAEALLERDAGAGFEAWRGFFWLTDADAPSALTAWKGRTRAVFERGLAADATASEQAVLIELLIRAGFGPEAKRFAEDAGLAARAGGDKTWAKDAAYFRFRDGLDAANRTFNRKMARGGRSAGGGYEHEVKRLAGELMAANGLKGDPRVGLEAAYGLYGSIGETSGYPSAHIGHVVVDEQRTVEQYGRTGTIRFIAVSRMLSNGFETWLWDGRFGTGGWAESGGVIIQVRDSYAAGLDKAWALTQPGPGRARFDERLPMMEDRDVAALKTAPVAFLPGVSARLKLQAYEQVLAKARAAGGSPAEVRRAFLDESYRATVQHSIFIHEGRHVLDQRAFKGPAKLSGEELEYRAKLSELALADYPRLPLSAVDGDTIGADTPHGRANTRIMAGFAAWMTAHQGEIAGFDPSQPALLQLDKLSDDQIRAAARGMDPWAKGA